VRRTHVDVNEVDGIANVLENGLERHIQLTTVDASQFSVVHNGIVIYVDAVCLKNNIIKFWSTLA